MYTSYYRPTAMIKRSQVEPAVTYPADIVWGAAAGAQRINGAYIKETRVDIDGNVEVTANKELVKSLLLDTSKITDSDRELGSKARQYLTYAYTVKNLKGQPLNDFERTAQKTAALNEFTNKDRLELAVVGSLISAYERAQRQDAVMSRLDRSAPKLGQPGDKITVDLEVTKSNFSINYGVYFITGITDLGQMVFFSHRASAEIGSRITAMGTIKAPRDDATQLNRTKFLSNLS